MKKDIAPVGARRPASKLNWAGYKYWHLKTERGWVHVFEHRLVWQDFFGPIPDGSFIYHKNGIKTDNRIENLELIPSNSLHHRLYHHEQKVILGHNVGLWNKGKPKSAEHAAKIAAALRGKTKSPEHRAKLAAALRGRSRPDISARLKGKKHTAEWCRKHSGAMVKRWQSRKNK